MLTWTKTDAGYHTNDALLVINRGRGRYYLCEVTVDGQCKLFTGSLADCKAEAERVVPTLVPRTPEDAQQEYLAKTGQVDAPGFAVTDDGAGIACGQGQVVLMPRDANGKVIEKTVPYHPQDEETVPGNTTLPGLDKPVLDFEDVLAAQDFVDPAFDVDEPVLDFEDALEAAQEVKPLPLRVLADGQYFRLAGPGGMTHGRKLTMSGEDVVTQVYAGIADRTGRRLSLSGMTEVFLTAEFANSLSVGYNSLADDDSQNFDEWKEQDMATATATAGKLKVDRTEARELFKALGYKNSKSWEDAELHEHLAALASEDQVELPEGQARLRQVIEGALEKGRPLELGDRPAPKGSAAPANGKAEGKKGSKQKAPKANGEGGSSNKEVVYKEWLKKKDNKTPPEIVHYSTLVKAAVKENTIRGWISAWGRGQNLPACAKS